MIFRFLRNVAFLSLGVCCAAAQESIQYGSISGRVEDASGAVVQDAKVTSRQKETNIGSTQLTGRDGRFRFPYLSVGEYEIVVQHPGFADVVRTVNVGLGSAFELPIVLNVAAAQNQVTVSSQADVLEAARTQIAGTVSQTEVASLPLNGRNFLDLALLVPGVSPTNTAANQLFAETSAVPGQGISIGSQRNFSNSFIVDGLSEQRRCRGLDRRLLRPGRRERISGGHLRRAGRVRPRAGRLRQRGHQERHQHAARRPVSAISAISGSTPPMRCRTPRLPVTQAQYGASLGGPIVRDRTFYFANFEQRELNQSGLITISPANVAAINARLRAIGYPGPQISTGIYPNPVHNSNFFAQGRSPVQRTDQFSVRYSLYHVTSINSRGAGGLSAPTASANLDDTDQTIAVSNIATLSPRAGERNARAVHEQQSAGSAVGPDRAGRQHFGRGFFRHAFGIAHRP